MYPVVLIKTHQLAVEWKLCKISYWKSDTFLINSIQIAFKFEWATFKHGVTKVTQQITLNHRVKRKILNYICSSNCNGGQKIRRETRYREKKCISPHHLKLVSIWLQSVRSITFCRQALTAVKAKRLKTGSMAESLKEQILYPKGGPTCTANPATVTFLITFLHICTCTVHNFRGLC